MKILKQEVQHIAKLARLRLNEKEIEKYQKELSLVLGYVENLKKQKFSNQEKNNYFSKTKNVFRKDELDKIKKSDKKDLINLMPKTKDNYLKVKAIL